MSHKLFAYKGFPHPCTEHGLVCTLLMRLINASLYNRLALAKRMYGCFLFLFI